MIPVSGSNTMVLVKSSQSWSNTRPKLTVASGLKQELAPPPNHQTSIRYSIFFMGPIHSAFTLRPNLDS